MNQASPVDNSKLRMSATAVAKMRAHEKAVYHYYDDGGPGKGNCTWGIGTLAHRGPCTAMELKIVVNPAAVESAFTANVGVAEQAVLRAVKNCALTQEQFDALVSYTYNVGSGRAQATLRRVDKGDLKAAATGISASIYMSVKNKAGKTKMVIARGLVRRRAEESAPFRGTDK